MYPMDHAKAWANRSRMRFRCAHCDEIHHGLPEISYRLPAAVAALDEAGRTSRALVLDEYCILDGRRYFIRAFLSAPIEGHNEAFGWGVWVETRWPTFKTFWEDSERAEAEGDPGAAFRATLANGIDGFPRSLGLTGIVRPQPDGNRPRLDLVSRTAPLARAQRHGISAQQAIQQAQAIGVLLMVA